MKEWIILHKLRSSNPDISKEAYKKVYNEYYKLLYFICGKYLNNQSDIEDIVIDSCVSFYNERHKVNNIKYFLVTVCKNKAINLAKKKSNYELCGDEIIENTAYHSDVQYTDIMEEIYKCLSKEDASIVIEHVVEGVPLTEIASRMNLSVNTLKSRYRRSIKKLNHYLGGKYE